MRCRLLGSSAAAGPRRMLRCISGSGCFLFPNGTTSPAAPLRRLRFSSAALCPKFICFVAFWVARSCMSFIFWIAAALCPPDGAVADRGSSMTPEMGSTDAEGTGIGQVAPPMNVGAVGGLCLGIWTGGVGGLGFGFCGAGGGFGAGVYGTALPWIANGCGPYPSVIARLTPPAPGGGGGGGGPPPVLYVMGISSPLIGGPP
jgi:hypothetical protein